MGDLTQPSTIDDLVRDLRRGEDSTQQFKRDVAHVDALAVEMAAFANSEGGTIYLGVDDDGTTVGLSPEDVRRLNPLIANAASQHVRSPLVVHTRNVALEGDRVVIVGPLRGMFDDRVEIVSPGTLPNSLTVDKIRAGNSNLRNPILASFVAKGLLPYRGLGTGVPRALEEWPHIELRDDRDANLFVATVRRPQPE